MIADGGYVHYYILEQWGDAKKIRQARLDDSLYCYVPISASAMADVGAQALNPVIALHAITSHPELLQAIAFKRDFLWELLCKNSQLPHYKIKMLLDSFCEKQVLVDLLSSWSGTKHYIGQRDGVIPLFGDVPETLRSAALYMHDRQGFFACRHEGLPRIKPYLYSLAAQIYKLWRAKRSALGGKKPFVTEKGYGIKEVYAARAHVLWDSGSLGLAVLHARLPFVKKSTMLLHWLLLYTPMRFRKNSPLYFGAINGYLKRFNVARKLVSQLFDCGAIEPEYVFGATYSEMVVGALVAEAKRRHIPVITMQHAAVGHDQWLGVRYADAWQTDAKIVCTEATAGTLLAIEQAPHCTYIAAGVTHLNAFADSLKPWDGKSFVYIATGFVRNNIMYDQRRVNDCLYFFQMREKIAQLSKRLSLALKPHPFDKRQGIGAITDTLAAQHAMPIMDMPTRQLSAVAIIDSPSTALADLVLAGVPVFILNATCVLTETFQALAEETQVLHDSADALLRYLAATDITEIMHSQARFRSEFAKLYLLHAHPTPIPEVIANYLQYRPSLA